MHYTAGTVFLPDDVRQQLVAKHADYWTTFGEDFDPEREAFHTYLSFISGNINGHNNTGGPHIDFFCSPADESYRRACEIIRQHSELDYPVDGLLGLFETLSEERKHHRTTWLGSFFSIAVHCRHGIRDGRRCLACVREYTQQAEWVRSLIDDIRKRAQCASNHHRPSPGDTPFEVLGVSETASFEEFKRAYRALIKEYHPDRHVSRDIEFLRMTEARTKRINWAWEEVNLRMGQTQQRPGRDE